MKSQKLKTIKLAMKPDWTLQSPALSLDLNSFWKPISGGEQAITDFHHDRKKWEPGFGKIVNIWKRYVFEEQKLKKGKNYSEKYSLNSGKILMRPNEKVLSYLWSKNTENTKKFRKRSGNSPTKFWKYSPKKSMILLAFHDA